MTNSHNRNGKHGNQAERYFNNHSPQQCNGSSGKRNNSASNNSGNGGRGQKSPSSSYFRSISSSNAIPIVKSSTPVSSKGSNYYVTNSPSGRPHSFNIGSSYLLSSPGGCYAGSLPGSPPNFSRFAGSKCYDAPAPTALPKPPVHWTSTVSSITTETSALNTSTTSTNKPASVSVVAKNTSCKSSSSTVLSSSASASRVKGRTVNSTMSCAAAAAKTNRNDVFSNNLKMMLNVQA